MSPEFIAVVGVLGSAFIGLAGVIYVQRTTRDLKDEDRKSANAGVEAQAYARARESYEAAITRYQGEIARLIGRVESCEVAARRAEDRAENAERRVDLLESVLRENDVPVPPLTT